MLRKFKVVKIVYANDINDAMKRERNTEIDNVFLDEEVPNPSQPENKIGFQLPIKHGNRRK